MAVTHHRIRKGLDLPIPGAPVQSFGDAPRAGRVAVVAADTVGLKPRMLVAEGDAVLVGTPLFEDKQRAGVVHTSPAGGTVVAINRGERRSLLSVVVEVADDEGTVDPVTIGPGADDLRAALIRSGLWTSLRTRPFGRTPKADAVPRSIFVTAIDTDPLAADPAVVLADRHADLVTALTALIRLAPVKLCVATGSPLAACGEGIDGVAVHTFAGPHPAGTAGLHIHLVDPVGAKREVWHLDAQDAATIGRFVTDGTIDVSRVIALSGPGVITPRLLRTRVGAAIAPLVVGQLVDDAQRVIAGSVLSGRAVDELETAYLGRFHRQICALPRGDGRHLLGWIMPGLKCFGALRTFVSAWLKPQRFVFTTDTNGSVRGIIPNAAYDRVTAFDLLPTFLLRSLQAEDLERSEELGALELIEEDLALLSFVCPGKIDHGLALRRVLTRIEQEG